MTEGPLISGWTIDNMLAVLNSEEGIHPDLWPDLREAITTVLGLYADIIDPQS